MHIHNSFMLIKVTGVMSMLLSYREIYMFMHGMECFKYCFFSFMCLQKHLYHNGVKRMPGVTVLLYFVLLVCRCSHCLLISVYEARCNVDVYICRILFLFNQHTHLLFSS